MVLCRVNAQLVVLCLVVVGLGFCCPRKSPLYNLVFQSEDRAGSSTDSSVKVLSLTPMSINVIHGGTAVFSCIARGEEISFFINGEKVQQLEDRNYILSDLKELNETTSEQNFTVTNVDQDSHIECRATQVQGNMVLVDISDLATLLVQGPALTVIDLSYSLIDSSTVNITWIPPYTLPGTDIKGYNVSVKNSSYNVIVDEYVHKNYYVLYNVSFCEDVSVSGFNGLNGTIKSILIDPTAVHTIPITVEKLVLIGIAEHSHLVVVFGLNVSSLCPGKYFPTHVKLVVHYANGTLAATKKNIHLQLTNDIHVATTNISIQVPMNNNYTVTLTFNHLDPSISSLANFSPILFYNSFVEVLNFSTSINVVRGDTAVFNCIVRGDELHFFLNGTKVEKRSDRNHKLGPLIELDNTTLEQNLTLYRIEQDTHLYCEARKLSGSTLMVARSTPATISVQGPLSAVYNLLFSFIDPSTVNISWYSPFTLPGTEIKGYNVSIMNRSHNVIVNKYVHKNYYILHNASSCENVSVSGFNGLNGRSSSIILIDGSTIYNIRIAVKKVILINPLNLVVIFQLNVSSLCSMIKYPTHVNLTVQYSDGKPAATVNNVPLASTKDTDILATSNSTIPIPVDNNYTATLTFNYLDSKINSSTMFSTRTVWVSYANDTVDPSVLVFTCHFLHYSDAVGCLIKLVYSNDTTVQFKSTGTRTDDDIATVTIHRVRNNGVYQLLLYEIGGDGKRTVLIRKKEYFIQLPSTPHGGEQTFWIEVGSGVFAAILLMIIIIIIIVIIVYYCLYRNHIVNGCCCCRREPGGAAGISR